MRSKIGSVSSAFHGTARSESDSGRLKRRAKKHVQWRTNKRASVGVLMKCRMKYESSADTCLMIVKRKRQVRPSKLQERKDGGDEIAVPACLLSNSDIAGVWRSA